MQSVAPDELPVRGELLAVAVCLSMVAAAQRMSPVCRQTAVPRHDTRQGRAATRHEAGPCRVSSCLRPCGQVAEGLVLQAAVAALLAAVAALLTLQPARAFLPVPPPP